MKIKNIDFKQKKYIYPLIAFPFILFLGYQFIDLFDGNKKEKNEISQEVKTSLGDVPDTIMTKNNAYDKFYRNGDTRTMIDGLDKIKDSTNVYTDNLTETQKRMIDSLAQLRRIKERSRDDEYNNQEEDGSSKIRKRNRERYNSNNDDDEDFKNSERIIKMLNGNGNGDSNNDRNEMKKENLSNSNNEEKEEDPIKMMRQQMLMMDSLEKSRDPEYQAKLVAEQRLKDNKEKMKKFLNSTYGVNKNPNKGIFNDIKVYTENKMIKAVIDENTKSYLGSRIRLRLLEDIYVKGIKIPKGTTLYSLISGFKLQRVELSVVAILNNGEILPVNLSVYDIDGMKGLYVPNSVFREMLRQLGSNTIQGGTPLENGGQSFYKSLLSNVFSSASQTISNIIRSNKVRLKYNTYIYLIDEKELESKNNK